MSQFELSLEAFLRRLQRRTTLSKDERAALLALPFEIIALRAHQDLVDRSDYSSHVSVVVNGMLGSFEQDRRGARQITAIYLPGDAANLQSLVHPQRSWGFQALCSTTILNVPHIALRDVLSAFPGLAEAFWRDCAVNNSISSAWVMSLGRRSAKGRIAHLFCELAIRTTGKSGLVEGPLGLPLVQSHIAEATGMTSVHVSRVLQELRLDGIAEHRNGDVIIINWDKLARVADFNPDYLHCLDRHEVN